MARSLPTLPALILGLASAVTACTPPAPPPVGPASPGPSAAATPLIHEASTPAPRKALKNVILVIGDGMGPQQVGLLQLYARRASQPLRVERKTQFDRMARLGDVGVSMTQPAESLVVDSACSATQLALGVAAPSEVIGLDARGTPQTSILEQAMKAGKATGLVSDTRLTHATPAAFAAHVHHRSEENEIARQMVASGTDVLLSGGLRHFLPQTVTTKESPAAAAATARVRGAVPLQSKRQDDLDLLGLAEKGGYALAFDHDGLRQQAHAVEGKKLLGLFASSGMLDAIASHDPAEAKKAVREPTLPEMTRAALDVLDRDPDGFFLMVEAGQIDWACHHNDAGRLLHEMLKMEEALKVILDYAEERDDTLVVVTADHETGGFGLSYSRHAIDVPPQLPGKGFEGHEYAPDHNFGDPTLLDRLASQKVAFGPLLERFRAEHGQLPLITQARKLQATVNAASAFPITEAEARAILADEKNTYRKAGHRYLDVDEFPAYDDDVEAFYVYGEDSRTDLIGRKLMKEQNLVWGTGTHTHTPVLVFSTGPAWARAPFKGLTHHAQLGKDLQRVLLKGPN